MRAPHSTSTCRCPELLWSFVDGEPRINDWRDVAEIPAVTPESTAMSKELKRRGFRFVGPTTCYAFMQAAGLVDDHTLDCFRRAACLDLVERRGLGLLAAAGRPADPLGNLEHEARGRPSSSSGAFCRSVATDERSASNVPDSSSACERLSRRSPEPRSPASSRTS